MNDYKKKNLFEKIKEIKKNMNININNLDCNK